MCPMPNLEWQGLRKGVQAMTTASGESEYTDPVLAAVEAQLFVGDITESGEYYTSKIGFSTAFTYCDPPFYGQVERDGGRLNLRRVGEPVFVDGIREREQCFLRC